MKMKLFIQVYFFLQISWTFGQSYNSSASQGAPVFGISDHIRINNSSLLDVGWNASPCVADWNGDGTKDLLVGTHMESAVFLFINNGTNAAPLFSTGTKLLADGKVICLTDTVPGG